VLPTSRLTGVGPGNYDDVLPKYEPLLQESARPLFESRATKFRFSSTRQLWTEAQIERLRQVLKSHVHCLYLQLAIDFGLLGLAGFLLTFLLILRELFTRRECLWSLAAIGAAAGFLFHNVFDATFPSLGFEIGLLLGAALGVTSKRIGKDVGSKIGSGATTETREPTG